MPLIAPAEHPDQRDLRDRAWWNAIRTGDVAAFEGLFRAHAPDLADFTCSYVGDPDVAQEIVHVLFCGLWEHRHTLETPRSVRGYLFTAARNRARNHSRDERTRAAFASRLAAADPHVVIGVVPATDAAAIGTSIQATVRRAIDELPPRCREVFTLVREHGLTHAETAAILLIAPKTVEVHMTRALKLLRSRLASCL
jgi:RNA polymerase sigma-70 factor (ECF subfamily)